jgi:hypothetical protein
MKPARTVSVSIARPPSEVYAFVSDEANLSRWAAGLDRSRPVAFVPRNPHGVVDHRVTLEDATVVYVPMRVVENGEGSEVLFTLFGAPDDDVAAVLRDLDSLKRLLEERRDL